MYAHELEPEYLATENDPVGFSPESPFLPELTYQVSQSASDDDRPAASSIDESVESPFTTEYRTGDLETESEEALLHREIMAELQDEEFDEAVEELVNEVRGYYETQFQGELGVSPADAERKMAQFLLPLEEELNNSIEKMIREVAPIDNEALSEDALDRFLADFHYETQFDNPAFEGFFKKIWRKAKKAVKRVAKKGLKFAKKAVGKGLKIIKKFSPIHMILGRLKKLVKPLLRRVLKFALNRLPVRFRPLARRLARRFLKGALGEVESNESVGELAELEDLIGETYHESDPDESMLSSEAIGQEFDALLTGYIIEGEDFDYEAAVAEYMSEDAVNDEDIAHDLDRARERFIDEIGNIENEEEIVAEIERFIPAILAGLRIGIKIIGRKRVVNFLAKLVAKLIGRFVGRQASRPLSRALVDAGLRLVSLENPEEHQRIAGDTLATVTQETIENFVREVPDDSLDDEAVMALHAEEAFNKAVVRNFPPKLLKRRLRVVTGSSGTWTMLPAGRRRKSYKKFTETFEIEITPAMAKQVRSFGGKKLADHLRDRLGIPIDKGNVRAKVHLYEGIRGTSLSDISHLERNVEGLGSRDASAWSRIHPLTRRAAAVLIPKAAGLGQRTPGRFLQKRTKLGIGQRFYFLEISGSRVVRAPAPGPTRLGSAGRGKPPVARTSDTAVHISKRTRRITIYQFVSEVVATRIAQDLRAGKATSSIVRNLARVLRDRIRQIFKGRARRNLNVRRESSNEEGMLISVASLMRLSANAVSNAIAKLAAKGLVKEMASPTSELAKKFAAAANEPQDGITIVYTIDGANELMDILDRNAGRRAKGLARLAKSGLSGKVSIDIVAGSRKRAA